MNTNEPLNQDNQEIDLFLLFSKIGDFFRWIGFLIFKSMQFVVKNAVLLFILILLGFGIGYYLDTNNKQYDNQIIVAPNFKSTEYLYTKIDLLASKIAEKDFVFLTAIGLKNSSSITKIKIEPVVDIYKLVNDNDKNLELLELMAQSSDFKSIVKETITAKNYNFHTIIVSTNGAANQEEMIDPILKYLNKSPYFEAVQKIAISNIERKINEKEAIVGQIDTIINAFSKKNAKGKSSDKLIYYNENTQLTGIIIKKDSLISDLGALKMDLYNSEKVINDNAVVLNIKDNKFINGKMKLVLPLVFISVFIMLGFVISFYKRHSLK
jgi:uncharacterized membrane protein